MQTTCRLDNTTKLADLKGESSILKLLLHDTSSKDTQVTKLVGAVAIGLALREASQGFALAAGLDPVAVALDDLAGLVLGAGNAGLRALG